MPLEDVQSLQSDVDSIGLGDLDQTEDSIPEEEDDFDEETGDLDPRVQVRFWLWIIFDYIFGWINQKSEHG